MSTDLVLDSVTKRFPGSPSSAVADVTLSVPRGACTAVLGPSGSGKTTLLRLIAGLELPDTGRVLIGGDDVVRVPAERRGVGMVFQKSMLFPHLSVLDNVAFAARAAGESRSVARARAAEHLDMVQLRGFGSRRVGELSGGQEQRVAIARALAAEPAVLLLDEPFSALDPSLRTDMHDLIEQVRLSVGPTIVLVTHDRDEASRVADRIAVLEHGRVLHEGTVAEAYRAPATARVAALMGGRNRIAGTMSGGIHRSALGSVRVPGAPQSGTGILLIRQEDIVLLGERDVFEADADDVTVSGIVASLRVSGARAELAVLVGDVELHLDIASVRAPGIGDRVRMRIPVDSAHVVAG
ncbi:ABC transporter ATP-binding protein [Planococcus sp. APC 4015]|nr:ABC transporter ATP-binding protein [Planococcus sp. APC 4015]